jgi:predicted RNA-binding Zn-ribbon protein involved in translation (DUF1610 family)
MSNADELIKLKELLDSGVLSQEEFDIEKEKLLNQDKSPDDTSKEVDVYSLKEAQIDEKTGEPSCPYCGGTNIKTRRNKAARFAAISTLGMANMAIPKTAVKCKSCGKTFSRRNIKK